MYSTRKLFHIVVLRSSTSQNVGHKPGSNDKAKGFLVEVVVNVMICTFLCTAHPAWKTAAEVYIAVAGMADTVYFYHKQCSHVGRITTRCNNATLLVY